MIKQIICYSMMLAAGVVIGLVGDRALFRPSPGAPSAGVDGPQGHLAPWKTSDQGQATSRPQPLGAPQVVTNAEAAEVAAIEERRARGEYTLKLDDPRSRRSEAEIRHMIVARRSEIRAREYGSLFAQLGVRHEVAEQLLSHLAQIQDASMQVSTALSQFLNAQNAYDERVRSVLGEDGYAAYRESEDSKPVRREFELFQKFLGQNGRVADAKYDEAVRGVIQEQQAYSERRTQGPYDQPPTVVVGKEQVMSHMLSEADQLAAKAAAVGRQLADLGIPDDYRQLVDAYYRARIQAMQSTVMAVRDAKPGRQAP